MPDIRLKVKIVLRRDVKSLVKIADDIDALAQLVPEWNQFEAEEITGRIQERMVRLLKLQQGDQHGRETHRR